MPEPSLSGQENLPEAGSSPVAVTMRPPPAGQPPAGTTMYLYQSNRLQELFRQLCAIIATPLADPLQPEIIVVHNQGMARWLQQQIARERGIAANLEFPLPARFVWDLFAGQLGELPAESVFDRDVMLWRIFALLPDLAA
ncbi:MAG TPA: hypothetical protein ENI89_02395, partial [Desulfobulbus sp.]|nr:hypothetical protein [Desulfobulbus sp.]